MLNQEFVLNEWIPALLSGRFVQGRENLCQLFPTGPQHCCLGVACEIKNVPKHIVRQAYVMYSTESNTLPSNVAAAIFNNAINRNGAFSDCFEKFIGYASGNRYSLTLAELNDDGVSFEEIARILYNACVYETLWGQPAFWTPEK